MSLSCMLKMHRPASGEVWNNGFFFTTCSSCRKPLVRRRGAAWTEVPKGFKIVWKRSKSGSNSWKPWQPDRGAGDPQFRQAG